MKIGFAQINPTVGDLSGNFEKIISAYERLAAAGAELVLTPELAITGYPPQDLVFKSRFVPENLKVLEQLHARVGKVPLLVGFVDRNNGRGKPFHNAAALLEAGKPIRKAHKSLLPTYDVFDEDRYFEPAAHVEPFDAVTTASRVIPASAEVSTYVLAVAPVMSAHAPPDELHRAAQRLRWYRWDVGEPETGWSLRLAVEDTQRGRAWAVSAVDAAL